MANVVQKSRYDGLPIGSGLLHQLGALQGVFNLRYGFTIIRILTGLGEEVVM